MLDLCVFFDLFSFVSHLNVYVVECNVMVCCHAYIQRVIGHSWRTNPNEFCITFLSCFCSLLTSKWEISTGSLHYSFVIFTQIPQESVISSYIDDIETNLPVGKHTCAYLHGVLRRLLAKVCFVLHLCLFRFVAFRFIFNELCC